MIVEDDPLPTEPTQQDIDDACNALLYGGSFKDLKIPNSMFVSGAFLLIPLTIFVPLVLSDRQNWRVDIIPFAVFAFSLPVFALLIALPWIMVRNRAKQKALEDKAQDQIGETGPS